VKHWLLSVTFGMHHWAILPLYCCYIKPYLVKFRTCTLAIYLYNNKFTLGSTCVGLKNL